MKRGVSVLILSLILTLLVPTVHSRADSSFDEIKGQAYNSAGTVNDKAKDLASSTSDAAGNVKDKAKDLPQATNDAAGTVNGKAKDLASSTGDAAGDVKEKAKGVPQATKDAAGTVNGKAKDLASSTSDAAGDMKEKAIGSPLASTVAPGPVGSTIKDKASQMSSGASNAAGAVKDKAKQIPTSVNNAAKTMKDKTADMTNSVGNAAGSMVNGVKKIPDYMKNAPAPSIHVDKKTERSTLENNAPAPSSFGDWARKWLGSFAAPAPTPASESHNQKSGHKKGKDIERSTMENAEKEAYKLKKNAIGKGKDMANQIKPNTAKPKYGDTIDARAPAPATSASTNAAKEAKVRERSTLEKANHVYNDVTGNYAHMGVSRGTKLNTEKGVPTNAPGKSKSHGRSAMEDVNTMKGIHRLTSNEALKSSGKGKAVKQNDAKPVYGDVTGDGVQTGAPIPGKAKVGERSTMEKKSAVYDDVTGHNVAMGAAKTAPTHSPGKAKVKGRTTMENAGTMDIHQLKNNGAGTEKGKSKTILGAPNPSPFDSMQAGTDPLAPGKAKESGKSKSKKEKQASKDNEEKDEEKQGSDATQTKKSSKDNDEKANEKHGSDSTPTKKSSKDNEDKEKEKHSSKDKEEKEKEKHSSKEKEEKEKEKQGSDKKSSKDNEEKGKEKQGSDSTPTKKSSKDDYETQTKKNSKDNAEKEKDASNNDATPTKKTSKDNVEKEKQASDDHATPTKNDPKGTSAPTNSPAKDKGIERSTMENKGTKKQVSHELPKKVNPYYSDITGDSIDSVAPTPVTKSKKPGRSTIEEKKGRKIFDDITGNAINIGAPTPEVKPSKKKVYPTKQTKQIKVNERSTLGTTKQVYNDVSGSMFSEAPAPSKKKHKEKASSKHSHEKDVVKGRSTMEKTQDNTLDPFDDVTGDARNLGAQAPAPSTKTNAHKKSTLKGRSTTENTQQNTHDPFDDVTGDATTMRAQSPVTGHSMKTNTRTNSQKNDKLKGRSTTEKTHDNTLDPFDDVTGDARNLGAQAPAPSHSMKTGTQTKAAKKATIKGRSTTEKTHDNTLDPFDDVTGDARNLGAQAPSPGYSTKTGTKTKFPKKTTIKGRSTVEKAYDNTLDPFDDVTGDARNLGAQAPAPSYSNKMGTQTKASRKATIKGRHTMEKTDDNTLDPFDDVTGDARNLGAQAPAPGHSMKTGTQTKAPKKTTIKGRSTTEKTHDNTLDPFDDVTGDARNLGAQAPSPSYSTKKSTKFPKKPTIKGRSTVEKVHDNTLDPFDDITGDARNLGAQAPSPGYFMKKGTHTKSQKKDTIKGRSTIDKTHDNTINRFDDVTGDTKTVLAPSQTKSPKKTTVKGRSTTENILDNTLDPFDDVTGNNMDVTAPSPVTEYTMGRDNPKNGAKKVKRGSTTQNNPDRTLNPFEDITGNTAVAAPAPVTEFSMGINNRKHGAKNVKRRSTMANTGTMNEVHQGNNRVSGAVDNNAIPSKVNSAYANLFDDDADTGTLSTNDYLYTSGPSSYKYSKSPNSFLVEMESAN